MIEKRDTCYSDQMISRCSTYLVDNENQNIDMDFGYENIPNDRRNTHSSFNQKVDLEPFHDSESETPVFKKLKEIKCKEKSQSYFGNITDFTCSIGSDAKKKFFERPAYDSQCSNYSGDSISVSNISVKNIENLPVSTKFEVKKVPIIDLVESYVIDHSSKSPNDKRHSCLSIAENIITDLEGYVIYFDIKFFRN